MIVLTSGRSLTETGPLLQWYLESEDSYWRTAYNLGLRDRTRSLRAALLLVIALSGGVLGLLWWNSGNRARLSRLPRLLRFSGRRRGSEPVRLSCRPPERGIVLAASETRMETTFRPDGSLEVAAADSAAASEMRSLLWMRGVVPEAGVRAARAGPDELVDLSVGERISEGVRIVVTDLVASEGDVTVLQHPIPREAEAVRPCLGYMPDSAGLYEEAVVSPALALGSPGPEGVFRLLAIGLWLTIVDGVLALGVWAASSLAAFRRGRGGASPGGPPLRQGTRAVSPDRWEFRVDPYSGRSPGSFVS